MTTEYTQEQQQAYIDTVSQLITAVEQAFLPPHPSVETEGNKKYQVADPTEPLVCLTAEWCMDDFVLRLYTFADATKPLEALKGQDTVRAVPVNAEVTIAEVERRLADDYLADTWTLRQYVRTLRVLEAKGFTLRRYVGYPSRLPMIEFTQPDHPIGFGWLYEVPVELTDGPEDDNRVVH